MKIRGCFIGRLLLMKQPLCYCGTVSLVSAVMSITGLIGPYCRDRDNWEMEALLQKYSCCSQNSRIIPTLLQKLS
ncbi:hypothetical protein [Paenibacillus plantiphilus]|uniref:hypothetical protein n=1 Tax=Paenibacillus plantiphilus TaxID=2905650 RepID=UPI001F38679F|nr:hypothetical protein [Paenibacillus plantiphilus]